MEDKGHSTGTLVATGLLSFGAGLLVANIFDDDDDDYYHNGYYNPYYGAAAAVLPAVSVSSALRQRLLPQPRL